MKVSTFIVISILGNWSTGKLHNLLNITQRDRDKIWTYTVWLLKVSFLITNCYFSYYAYSFYYNSKSDLCNPMNNHNISLFFKRNVTRTQKLFCSRVAIIFMSFSRRHIYYTLVQRAYYQIVSIRSGYKIPCNVSRYFLFLLNIV